MTESASFRGPLLLTLAGIAILGGLFTWVNLDLPVVRNSLDYAWAAEQIIGHGFNPIPVVSDPALSHGKPIGFAMLSSPVVAVLGTNVGLKVASFCSTMVLLASAVLLLGSIRWRASDPLAVPLALWIFFFSPLTMYQFWSAHPDSLFAALLLLAVALIHLTSTDTDRDVRSPVVLLGIVIVAAFLLKNYGAILLVISTMYALLHVRRFVGQGVRTTHAAWWLAGVLSGVAGFIMASDLGFNPLSRVTDVGGGFDRYDFRHLPALTKQAVVQLAVGLLLNFNVLLVYLFRRANWSGAWRTRIGGGATIYIAGLLPFRSTYYNMRFFLPVFFVVAVLIANGIRASKAYGVRWVTMGLFVLTNACLVLTFNVASVNRMVDHYVSPLTLRVLGVHDVLDNLRLGYHLDQADVVAVLNAEVKAGEVVYCVEDYDTEGAYETYQRAGLVRPGLIFRYQYVPARLFSPPREQVGNYYVMWGSTRSSPPSILALGHLGHVVDLGAGIFRVSGTDAAR